MEPVSLSRGGPKELHVQRRGACLTPESRLLADMGPPILLGYAPLKTRPGWFEPKKLRWHAQWHRVTPFGCAHARTCVRSCANVCACAGANVL